MMDATDMSKSKTMTAKPDKPKLGRPPVLRPDQTEKVMYRSPETEYAELVRLAAEKGYMHRGEGTAAPLLLKVTLLYLMNPSIRQVVDSSRAVPPAVRGKAATLEYRNWLRCTKMQRAAIEDEALRQGSVRDGKGNPGPFIRKIMTRYLHDPSVRLAVDAVMDAAQPAGAS